MGKKVMCAFICLAVLIMGMAAACAEDVDYDEMKRLSLGSSPYAVVVNASYQAGGMTEEDLEEGQVGYYYSENALMDFDVYQIGKDGHPDTLAEFVVEEASQHVEVTEIVRDGEINGIPAAWYRAVEPYEDADYDTVTYILDAGDSYIVIVFWLDGVEAKAEADAVIHSLMEDIPVTLPLGTSGLSITLPAGFREGGMTEEDMEDGQVGYYYSDNTLLDVDVYQFPKGDASETPADYVAAEAGLGEGEGDVQTDVDINGIPTACYRAVEEYEGVEYETVTYVLDDGSYFMKIVFWLDGENAGQEAEDIVQTIVALESAIVAVEG